MKLAEDMSNAEAYFHELSKSVDVAISLAADAGLAAHVARLEAQFPSLVEHKSFEKERRAIALARATLKDIKEKLKDIA